MGNMNDMQLLADYAVRNSQEAFAALVQRHINLVYSVALRCVGDPHKAQEVAQSVFILLAQKASRLHQKTVLTGWLYQTARLTSARFLRGELRRQRREQEAFMQSSLEEATREASWEKLAPVLDDALGRLGESERNALLLRYFEDRSVPEVALALGLKEPAARKRLVRALEKLRSLFAKRGIAVSASGLAAAMAANSVQAAPAGLAGNIAGAVAAGAGFHTASTLAAAKVIAMTTFQKTLVVATVAAVASVGIYEARQASQLRAQVKTLQVQPPVSPPEVSAAALAALQEKVQALETQTNELTEALTRSKAEIARLGTEREQARRSVGLYKKLVEQASSKEVNPTNAYPTARHVFVGIGKMGRVFALAKGDQSHLSPAEQSALEEAQINALAELPALLKALKQATANEPSGAGQSDDERADMASCVLYGALNLDEQQFSQMYDLVRKTMQQSKQWGESKDLPPAQATEAAKQLLEQFKTQAQPLLTPEQNRLFPAVLNQFHIEPGGRWGYSANF
jgi:RNA polymerase sigma factor (sigma-70 family)